jgi:predicted esterase
MSAAKLNFVHQFLPGSQPQTAPTLLLLHGTGGNETDLLDLGERLWPEANRLGVRGKVLENGMPRFFRRLAEGVFDLEDLTFRTHELADFIGAAATAYDFDPKRVCAVGYSNGANIAGSLLLLRPGVLAGAVLLRPMVPLEPPDLPDLTGTPVFIGAGRFDPIAPPAQTERQAALLREAAAEVTVHYVETAHGLTAGDVSAATEWLHRTQI